MAGTFIIAFFIITKKKKPGTLLLLSDRVCAALAILELNIYTRLTSNSQRCARPCYQSVGMKVIQHHTWLECLNI